MTDLTSTIRGAAARLFHLLPFPLGRRLFRLWLAGLGQGEPAETLRRFFHLADDLDDATAWACQAYGEVGHVKHRLMGYHEFFLGRVRPGERVLDLGCGSGELAFDLACRGEARVVGLDANPEVLAVARKRFSHPHLSFVQADATQALPPGPWDAVVLSNVLEHLDNRPQLLARLKAELRPGRFLIRVPALDRDWRVPLRKELGLAHFSDKTHLTEYTQASLLAELAAAGLTVTHLQANWGEYWAEAR
jgi:2-polyprenyl-3-methyl-5-hydroxy-6-metoxy-1,4-benzoquinol methylase